MKTEEESAQLCFMQVTLLFLIYFVEYGVRIRHGARIRVVDGPDQLCVVLKLKTKPPPPHPLLYRGASYRIYIKKKPPVGSGRVKIGFDQRALWNLHYAPGCA